MVTEPLQASKNILGYTLQERIGSGGFGEVWSAIAPGGLMKAVKIVYGYHDEKRAQAELKALDRVKEVRHPFLLSLERIEVHEGQLIVVSELADKSMADLFNEFIARGEPGIPREELLKYLRSTADALDYLSDEHGLQHLDVKPENLLIVSGHVKVADFGLIKDLHEASQSLMSGMTPAYAAPELFDGRPGTKSDQYSLAIVYQEMLTGVRPFPGTTPAQLAAQHMHGKPNLRPLPKGDQSVIARALSKDPGVRFKDSRSMAEELSNRKRVTKKAIRRIQTPGRVNTDTESNTVVYDQRDATALISSGGLPFQASEIQSLDPPECDADSAKLQPVLVVGVGATANRVVKQLKKQLMSRHSSMEEVPAIRMVCIDTDRSEITQLCMSNDEKAMTTSEVVGTPLCKPEVYRDRAKTHLDWLSRRWIYNIPRSLQTEGLRPLGRLALADHFDAVCTSLEDALKQITTVENVAQTAEALEMNPGTTQPRVFVITSISGGVGSGMTLDLAYTIKLLMAEQGLETNSVTGILLHSTYQRTRDPGLSAANAFAFMTEMRHYVENGYPGDQSMGLPEFEDEPPFDHTYFNELGNDLPQTEFDAQLSSIAEYIYLSSTSKCSAFFDKCRSKESELDHFALRTFGLGISGPGNLALGTNSVNHLSQSLIQRWISGRPDCEFDAQKLVTEQATELEVRVDDVTNFVTQKSHAAFDGSFEGICEGAHDIVMGGTSDRLVHLNAFFDGVLGCPPSRRDSSHVDPEICTQMEEILGIHAESIGDQIAQKTAEMLESSGLELTKPQSTAAAWIETLKSAGEQMQRANVLCENQIEQQLHALRGISLEKARTKPEEKALFEEVLNNYCQLRLEEFVLRYGKFFFRNVANGLSAVDNILRQYVNSLNRVSEDFAMTTDFSELLVPDSEFSIDRMLAESIESELDSHIDKTEIQIFESLVKELGGYGEMLKDSTCLANRLPREIRNAAQRVLADAYKKISLEDVIAQNGVTPEQVVKWLNEKVQEARPLVDDCGGASRVMLGVPVLSSESKLPEIFERQFNLNVKPINGTRGNIVICFEAEDVALANVAYRLLQARPDAVELVKRLHTRKDIDWSTLNDLL